MAQIYRLFSLKIELGLGSWVAKEIGILRGHLKLATKINKLQFDSEGRPFFFREHPDFETKIGKTVSK